MEKRLRICEQCPICDTDNMICNARLYLNPETNDVSVSPKEGYIKGCGCAILYKYKNKNKHCPAKKW